MGVRNNNLRVAYGQSQPLVDVFPFPIVSNRAPSANDRAALGQLWIDKLAGNSYVLTQIIANASTWVLIAVVAGGPLNSLTTTDDGTILLPLGNNIDLAGDATTITVTGAGSTATFALVNSPSIVGTLTVGNGLVISAGGANITGNSIITGDVAQTGNLTLIGDLAVTGNAVFTGDVDITDTASISLTSTNDAAGAITLTANGGTSETILIRSLQGTGANSLDLQSTSGGILLTAGRNNAQAIRLNATAGGVDIFASGAAAGEDIDIVATGSSVNINSTEDIANSIVISSTNGGIDISALGAAAGEDIDITATGSSVNLVSTEAVSNALRFNASDAAGGIDIDSGTGGFIVDTTGAFSIDGAAASNITTTGAGIDLTLSSVLGSVLVESTEDAALAIRLHANGGVSETIQIHSDQGTGVASIGLLSDVGGLTFRATGLASADAINLEAVAGGIDMNSALQTNIDSSQAAAANSIRIVASAADGGIDIDAGTGGITIDSTGAFSIDGAAASNITTTGAGIDLTLSSVLGSVLVESTENAALAIRLHANGGTSETIQVHSDQGTGVGSINLLSDVGGITITATGLASADAINLEAPAGGLDVDVALQMNLNSAQAAADAVRIIASDTAGGIDIDAGTGGISVVTTGAGNIAITAGATSNGTITLTSTGTGDIVLDSDDTMLLDADGVLELNSSAGAISIGNDADAQAINVGTGAAARTITVGNATAGTTVVVNSPTNTGITFATSLVRMMAGTGSPDTVVTAPTGSLFLRTDPAGATSRLYINTNGATAWTNITCAA